ncbi:MAG: GxxExxY protein [Acidobacteriia bacterium]|nr:GxxExxY protein [Terriglobia bacterium]
MSRFESLSLETECAATLTLDAAFNVHRILGPGLVKSVYEVCLSYELKRRGANVQNQVVIPIVYDGIRLEGGLRLDMLVDDQLVVKIKAAEAITPLHEAQLLTTLRLSRKRQGFLINFNVPLLRDGIRKIMA